MTQVAPVPDDEAARLEALLRLQILDTLPEQAYDDITYLASRICDTPIALVSLIDTDRQWFKSRVGLEATETSRDIAFCSHAILDPEQLLIVEDATLDSRFRENPLVTNDPQIRFYAGAPLTTSDGHALGTLCVIDRKARQLSPEQLQSLLALSRQVSSQLELRQALDQLAESSRVLHRTNSSLEKQTTQLTELCQVLETQADFIERDLHRAEIIQRSLLPQAPPPLAEFSVQSLYRPGRSIGGDLYDVVRVGDHHAVFVIADAAGHGVSAAMLSVFFKQRLQLVDPSSNTPYGPGYALSQINADLHRDISAPGVFVTAAICTLDLKTRRLTVASAGHPPLLWLKQQGGVEHITHTGPALGLSDAAHFEERQLELAPGDQLLLYTDGLFEANGDVGLEGLAEILRESPRDAGHEAGVLEETLRRVCRGQEREDRDDVTLLLLEGRPGPSRFGEAQQAFDLKASPRPELPPISFAESDDTTFLCLHGRVSWLLGQSLLDAVLPVVESGRALVLDLEGCEHLDSTLLGTLHESVGRAEACKTSLRLQRVPSAIRADFEELRMDAVLDHISDEPLPVPERRAPVELVETDLKHQRLRLLKAHEMLGELNEDNREKFQDVVDALRAEATER